MRRKMSFIGAGNMAEALVKGLLDHKLLNADAIRVADPRVERLEYFKNCYGIFGWENNSRAVQWANEIVLAVKPQQMETVLGELGKEFSADKLFISIMAGIKSKRIEEMLAPSARVIRVMPNTPALIGSGASAYCSGTGAREEDLQFVAQILESVGIAVPVEEKDMDAVTALSGSGPAYLFYLLESMQKAADDMGLDRVVARKLSLATVRGAARLMDETGEDASVLRKRVTSKGGTTAAALRFLNERNVREAVRGALLAARNRSKEISNE